MHTYQVAEMTSWPPSWKYDVKSKIWMPTGVRTILPIFIPFRLETTEPWDIFEEVAPTSTTRRTRSVPDLQRTENLSESKDATSEDAQRDEQLVRGAKHSTQIVWRDLRQVQRCQLRCHAYNITSPNSMAICYSSRLCYAEIHYTRFPVTSP